MIYLPAASVGKNKLDARWMDGVWLKIKLESGESIILLLVGLPWLAPRCRHPFSKMRFVVKELELSRAIAPAILLQTQDLMG